MNFCSVTALVDVSAYAIIITASIFVSIHSGKKNSKDLNFMENVR